MKQVMGYGTSTSNGDTVNVSWTLSYTSDMYEMKFDSYEHMKNQKLSLVSCQLLFFLSWRPIRLFLHWKLKPKLKYAGCGIKISVKWCKNYVSYRGYGQQLNMTIGFRHIFNKKNCFRLSLQMVTVKMSVYGGHLFLCHQTKFLARSRLR